MSLPNNNPFEFMKKMPQYFWLLLCIFTVTFGIIFLDHFRTYSSQVTILVVHKNEKTAASSDQVVENIAQLPKTLAFYNRLLKQSPEVQDPWSGMSNDERSTLWKEHVSVSRIDASGIIQLTINANTATDATLLAEKSSANLFQLVGQYYDIRTDVDIRSVGPALTYTDFSQWFGWFLASVSAGFVAAFSISFGLKYVSQYKNIFEKLVTRKVENPKKETLKQSFLSDDSGVVVLGSVIPSEIPQEDATIKVPSENNLPFLEEGISLEEHLFGVASNKKESEEIISKDDVVLEKNNEIEIDKKDAKHHPEPTAEELKQRLNQLLKGDM